MDTIESNEILSEANYYIKLDGIGKKIVSALRNLLNKYLETYKEYISAVEVNPSFFFPNCLIWITFKIPPCTTTKHLIKFYYLQGCNEEEEIQDFKKTKLKENEHIYIDILRKLVIEMKKETTLYRFMYKKTMDTTLDNIIDKTACTVKKI